MTTLRTTYDFTLPRGYVDDAGRVHKTGVMRLATARDELEPLRDVSVRGADDPRLTILVLTRVLVALGDLELITARDVEGLFAVDLAYLQDFYGVINFGSQEEYDALVNAQASSSLLGVDSAAAPAPTADSADPEPAAAAEPASTDPGPRPNLRRAVEEIPRKAQ
ncbi:hypothetical protein BH11ACT8_BH11ACT8_15340 [soil metagenome]